MPGCIELSVRAQSNGRLCILSLSLSLCFLRSIPFQYMKPWEYSKMTIIEEKSPSRKKTKQRVINCDHKQASAQKQRKILPPIGWLIYLHHLLSLSIIIGKRRRDACELWISQELCDSRWLSPLRACKSGTRSWHRCFWFLKNSTV
jgi:hypothetical protein